MYDIQPANVVAELAIYNLLMKCYDLYGIGMNILSDVKEHSKHLSI